MLSEKRSLRWKRPLFSLLLFVFLDFTAGTLIFQFAPYRIDNRSYRRSSQLYHHDLKPNVAALAGWGSNRYRIYTNSLGFKDAAVRDIPLGSDKWRVLLLGDSFTEGLGYAYEETFAGILHMRLAPRGIDVLNAGVSSYSPVIYYRKAKHLIEEVRLDVDEVIVFLDISDIGDEAKFYALSEDDRVVYQPRQSGKSIDPAKLPWMPPTGTVRLQRLLREHSLSAMVVERLWDHLHPDEKGSGPLGPWVRLLRSERANWTHDAAAFAALGERGLERATRSMNLLRDLLRRHSIPLSVVVYPWPNQIVACDRDSKQVQYWRAWAAANGSRFVDLFGEFFDGNDPVASIRTYYIEGDCHFNATGHQRVAEAMLERFQWTARP
jgi:hypothetical protein